MKRARTVLLMLVLVVLGGGFLALGGWNMAAPSKSVEKVIPDDRFPR